MKKNGISLIVLVITIIIMIILAAVIVITLNNTGIIKTAEGGVEKSNNKQTRLELELVLADLQKEKYGDKKKITDAYIDETLVAKDMLVDGDVVIVQGWLYIIDRERLVVISAGEKANLNKNISITAEPSTTDYKTATITINISGIDGIQKVKVGNGTNEIEITEIPAALNGVYTLTHDVTENGTYSVTVLDNNGGMNICSIVVDILEDDLVITNEEGLKLFRDMVNKGATFEGKTITLGKDIDLNSGKYSVGEDGIIVFDEDAEKWTPIGDYGTNTSLMFKGIFDAKGYEISGLYINTGKNYQGLFGNVDNGSIKNLELEGVVSASGYNYIGLLAGIVNNVSIENITTKTGANVTGKQYVGGLVGYVVGDISNCTNSSSVEGESISGGLVGRYYSGTATRCINSGNVHLSKTQMGGGIAGKTDNVTISESYNTAEITSVGGCVGGITGASANGTTIIYCYNTGKVSGNGYNDGGNWTSSGGISGENFGLIQYSYNTGSVYGRRGQIGGINGSAYNANGLATQYCYNIGEVTGSGGRMGSIIGQASSAKIDNCFWTSTPAGKGYSGTITNSSQLSEADMKAYTNEYMVADTIGVNDGYPILKWQLKSK